jgi:hypothetical protein
VSVEVVAVTKPAWSVVGWTRIYAKRFTVACCIRTWAVFPPEASSLLSSPHDH